MTRIINGIFETVENQSYDGVDVKTMLREELILTLDQLQFAVYNDNRKLFNRVNRAMYMEMVDILGFNLIERENIDEPD